MGEDRGKSVELRLDGDLANLIEEALAAEDMPFGTMASAGLRTFLSMTPAARERFVKALDEMSAEELDFFHGFVSRQALFASNRALHDRNIRRLQAEDDAERGNAPPPTEREIEKEAARLCPAF